MATFGQFIQLGPFHSGGNLQGSIKLYHYIVGTTTNKDVWTDREKTTTAAQPIVGDSQGIVSFFADGLYKFVVKTSDETTLYTYDNWNVTDFNPSGEGANLASASTVTTGTDGNYFHITGTTTITAFSSALPWFITTFDGILTLTHSGSLILQGGENVTTSAGDVYTWQNEGGGVFREVSRSSIRSALIHIPGQVENLGMSVTVSGNALTFALKTRALVNPSTSSPVNIAFRNATLTTGDYTVVGATAATSLVISAGSSLGFTSSQTSRIYFGALNNAGTIELWAYHPLSGTSLKGVDEGILYTTTAEGGGGGADSAQVMYSASARTNVAVRILGYIEIQTDATAGNWANEDTLLVLMHDGIHRTCDIIQSLMTLNGALATGTTMLPIDDTIPQITEGDQYMSQTITPTRAINLLQISHFGVYNNNQTNRPIGVALFQDSTANALAAQLINKDDVASTETTTAFCYRMVSGTTSATTFKIRAGFDAAGTTRFNASNTTRGFGGVMASSIQVEEIFV